MFEVQERYLVWGRDSDVVYLEVIVFVVGGLEFFFQVEGIKGEES